MKLEISHFVIREMLAEFGVEDTKSALQKFANFYINAAVDDLLKQVEEELKENK